MDKRTDKNRQMFIGIGPIVFAVLLAGWQIIHSTGTSAPQVLLSSLLNPQVQQQPGMPDDPLLK